MMDPKEMARIAQFLMGLENLAAEHNIRLELPGDHRFIVTPCDLCAEAHDVVARTKVSYSEDTGVFFEQISIDV